MLSAGADRVYALDGLDEVAALELLGAWEGGAVELGTLSESARSAAEELIGTGALEGDGVPEPQSLEVRWVGERDEPLDAHLTAGFSESSALCEADGDAHLLLFVRTTGRLLEVYESARPEPTPHLLLDLAYHHTVSLGPLVLAGETACLACLAGRVGSLWGDPEPPPRPAILDSPALAAALAVRELERAAAGDVRLANATAAYDLDAHGVTVGSVYRLPWCPVCGDGGETPGRIALPWSATA